MAEMDLGIEGLSDAEAVGAGGNAVVYRAREVNHDRWVAVKVLRGIADEAALRRFDRERRAMGRLSEHEGIVTIHSSGFTKTGEPYLVMPLMSDSLVDRLNRSGPMEWREAVELMAVVSRTVDAAHGQDVIHRDLKPGNILLTLGGSPLIADFGIARVTDSTTAAQSTALTFTPSYSAPEVLEGADASKAGDIYGLGATLYALVAGTPPFATEGGENVFALMRRIATQPVTDLRPLGVPDQVCVVIEKAMHKDPEHRYHSAAELAAALEGTVTTTAAQPGESFSAAETVLSTTADQPLVPAADTAGSGQSATPAARPDPIAPLDPDRTVPVAARDDGDNAEDRQLPLPRSPRPRVAIFGAVAAVVVVAIVAFVLLASGDDPETTTSDPTSTAANPTPAVIDTITVGTAPVPPIAADNLIWVPNTGDGTVSVIDPANRTVTDTITVGSSPRPSISADDLIWVSNLDDGTVSVIEPATRTLIDTITVGTAPNTPIAANALIWVPNLGDGTLSVIDPATRTVIDNIPVSDTSRTPIAANDLIWSPNFDAGTVSVIDPETRTIVDTITVGSSPVTPIAANDLIWVPNFGDGTVSVIDAATRTIIDNITVENAPDTPLVANDLIWVPNVGAGTVSVIDPAGADDG